MKRISIVLALALALVFVCILGGCEKSGEGVALAYGTGMGADAEYDSNLFYMNKIETQGADPGCLYVSEEQDADYGGWYYVYVTGQSKAIPSDYAESVQTLAFPCYRSKDLCTWEPAGSEAASYSLIVSENDWEKNDFCAPEVVYDAENSIYYMYYSATCAQSADSAIGNDSDTTYDRNYIGIASSSTPVGPFTPVSLTDSDTNEKVPCIDVRKQFSLPYFGTIDAHMLQDGQDLYLYFNNIKGSSGLESGIWGMKMLDYTTPDYTTLRALTRPNFRSVVSKTGAEAFTDGGVTTEGCEAYSYSEGTTNEGAYVIKKDGKYYLTYSANSYDSQSYSVHQAVSDSPLGVYVKVKPEDGNPILDGSLVNYSKGTGHHSFVAVGDELFIVYHRHGSNVSFEEGQNKRYLATDRVIWKETDSGETILSVCGPTASLQWLPAAVSGYKNLADSAVITASAGTGTQYLQDGIFPVYPYNETQVFSADKEVKISLSFEKPVTVRAIMIYNALNVTEAFSEITDIRFKFATLPDWASREYDYAAIESLKFPETYIQSDGGDIVGCAPAVATFSEITVSEISFTISESARISEFDKLGNLNTALQLTEIVVLGREDV